MKSFRVPLLAGGLLVACLASAQTPPTIVQPPVRAPLQLAPLQPRVPTFQVVRGKVPDELANRLGVALRISGKLALGDGSVRYMSPGFMSVPMKAVADSTPNEEKRQTRAFALQLEQLANVKPLDPEIVHKRALEAMKLAQLDVPGASPVMGHSTLEIHRPGVAEPTKYEIDTYVSYQFRLGALPLVGPGAKVRLAVSPSGETTNIRYAYRGTKEGPPVQIIGPEMADRLVASSFGTSALNLAKLKKSLVYYAPPIEMGTVQTIFPHYQYSGSFNVGKETYQVRDFLVPAVANAPKANVEASAQAGSVLARATISGGRAPYTFNWTSSGTPAGGDRQVFQYNSKNRGRGDFITLVVTDADGLRSIVRSKASPTPSELLFASFGEEVEVEAPVPSISRIDVGAEYVGATYADIGQPALGLTAGNASGFVAAMAMNAVVVQFFWGERDAWETDFKDSTAGGDDIHFSDDVDMTFFTGHANSNSYLVSSSNSDTNIVSSDPGWGDRDAEWVAIAACGPLQISNTLKTRWGPAFKGLHALLGYATNSADTDREGSTFVNYMRGYRFLNIQILPGQTVVNSWLQTGIDIQRGPVVIGAMGPVRTDGVTNIGDYFWGWGATGPDISGASISGFWVMRSGC